MTTTIQIQPATPALAGQVPAASPAPAAATPSLSFCQRVQTGAQSVWTKSVQGVKAFSSYLVQLAGRIAEAARNFFSPKFEVAKAWVLEKKQKASDWWAGRANSAPVAPVPSVPVATPVAALPSSAAEAPIQLAVATPTQPVTAVEGAAQPAVVLQPTEQPPAVLAIAESATGTATAAAIVTASATAEQPPEREALAAAPVGANSGNAPQALTGKGMFAWLGF